VARWRGELLRACDRALVPVFVLCRVRWPGRIPVSVGSAAAACGGVCARGGSWCGPGRSDAWLFPRGHRWRLASLATRVPGSGRRRGRQPWGL